MALLWGFVFRKCLKHPIQKKTGVCAFPMVVCHSLSSLLLSEIKKKYKFPLSSHASARQGQTPAAAAPPSMGRRKALSGQGWSPATAPAVWEAWGQRVTKPGKARRAGQMCYVTAFLGTRTENSFHTLSALGPLWRIPRTRATAPPSSDLSATSVQKTTG